MLDCVSDDRDADDSVAMSLDPKSAGRLRILNQSAPIKRDDSIL